MMVRAAKKWIWGTVLAVICLSTGCTLDQQLQIDPGYYQRVDAREGGSLKAPPFIEAVEVQHDRDQVVFHLRKGDPLAVPFSAREKDQWPTGCPGNLYSQRMEVFDLHVEPGMDAVLPFEDPVLVRNCPRAPYQLVLREDGKMGGSSTACPYPEACLFFVPFPITETDDKGTCSELEPTIEELQRQLEELEKWNQELVEGYGPSVWYFSETRYPSFHHHPDRETMDYIVDDLNLLFHDDGLPTIRVENISDRVVEVSVDDDIQLTQGMGSTGAQSYLKVVTYSLASLPGVDCVDFQFAAGDHAQPGVRCR